VWLAGWIVPRGSCSARRHRTGIQDPERDLAGGTFERKVATLLCVTPSPAIDRTARVQDLGYDRILRPTEVVVLPGGKGVNLARVAQRLGASVTTTGFAGGHAGRWLVESLAREGLDPQFVEVGPETRTTYVTVEPLGHSVIVYEPTNELADSDLARLLELMRTSLLPGVSRTTISGSLPRGIGIDGYPKLVSASRHAGRPCLVDVGGDALRAALEARPDVVKIAVDEARMAGFEGDVHELAVGIASAGAALAIVTDGEAGAIASTGSSSWRVTSPRVANVNSVGSGDAFGAALMVTLDKGGSVEEALAAGVGAGAANAERLSGGTIDPHRAAVLAGEARVTTV
jgi:tagatose 6-phosphate kinase